MNYQIDISFDLRKNPTISTIKNSLIDLAYNNNCTHHFSNCEVYGKFRNIIKQNYIISFFFETDDIITFLHSLKKYKYIRILTIISNDQIILPKYIPNKTKIPTLTNLDKKILHII